MYEKIEAALEKLDNPLVKQTVTYLISQVDSAQDDETSDVAKSALLLYLNATAPHILKNDVAVDRALTKSFSEVEETSTPEDSEKLLKQVLASAGIYYFGPLTKHNTQLGRPGDPKAPGDGGFPKRAAPPHVETGGAPMVGPGLPKLPTQALHANRPGKREMIGYLRDLQDLLPNFSIGQRKSLLSMSETELRAEVDRNLPGFFEGGHHRGVGMARNTTKVERYANLADYAKNREGSVAGTSSTDFKSALSNNRDGLEGTDNRVPPGTPQTGYDATGDGEPDLGVGRRRATGTSEASGGTTSGEKKPRAPRKRVGPNARTPDQIRSDVEQARSRVKAKATKERAKVPAADRAAERERKLAENEARIAARLARRKKVSDVKTEPGEDTAGQTRVKETEARRNRLRDQLNVGETQSQTQKFMKRFFGED